MHAPCAVGVTGKQVEDAVQAAEKKMADRQQRLEGAIVQVSLHHPLEPLYDTGCCSTCLVHRTAVAAQVCSSAVSRVWAAHCC